jgi:monoamine oxidase
MVLKYIDKLGLKTEPFYYLSVDKKQAIAHQADPSKPEPEVTRNSLFYVNRKRVVQNEYIPKDTTKVVDVNKLLDFHLSSSENMRADQLMANLINPLKAFIAEDPEKTGLCLLSVTENIRCVVF